LSGSYTSSGLSKKSVGENYLSEILRKNRGAQTGTPQTILQVSTMVWN